MTFGYQRVAPFKIDGTPGTADLPGFEGFDERVTTMGNSPPHSIDEKLTDLFDINADGLPDVLVTDPASYNGNHGVYFNGAGGTANAFGGANNVAVTGIAGEDANVIRLDNANIAAHDVDGDGIVDLLHMPRVTTYSVYTPHFGANGWAWQGRAVSTASQQSPKIDFQNNAPATRVMDVNGDGLVDVVFSSGTEYQTFFSLGRYPGGDGQYGAATFTGATTASISNDPVTSCLPWSASPALLSDPDVRIADMNGDGLPDIVRVRAGDLRYWPGRGNGFWGTGDPTACPGGSFGQGQDIAMLQSPQFGLVDGATLLLDDVNGDGLDDLVKVEFNSVSIYLNVNGTAWTDRHIILNSPARPAPINRVRLVDMNGSGTRDIVWGDGNSYKFIDLLGAARPWVLTHVANGLGKTTDFEYSTSTQMMLSAEAAGQPWQSKAPMPIHVVSRTTDRDNLGRAGRPDGAYVTEYAYRDPVYDGRQREFRGFRQTTVKRIGDANSPTSLSQSTFLLGDCKDDEILGGLPARCSAQGRWRDNPREPLKGLPVLSEAFDEAGRYVSTKHTSYRLRKLYDGLDGREVRVAIAGATDSFLYENAPFASAPQPTALLDVQLELTPGSATPDTPASVTLRSALGRAHLHSESTVDAFGNALSVTDAGCVDGCGAPDEVVTSAATPGIPSGDGSRWLFRTVESYITGSSGPATRRQDTFFFYDASGNLLSSFGALAGTLGLDRFHADPAKSVAPSPSAASQDGLIPLGVSVYDAFGNVTSSSASNGRCRTVQPDSDYAELPFLETVYVGSAAGAGTNSCGGVGLTASAVWDRGLAVPTSVTDVHRETTTIHYDGLGRVDTMRKPSPDNLGTPSVQPSLLVTYTLPADVTVDPTAKPYSTVHTRTQDGLTDSDASYRDSWAYVDGLGRTIVTLTQADPAAGDGGQWVVNGLAQYDSKGAVQRKFLSWFWSGDASTFPLGAPPATSYASQRYDAFGRQLQTFGLDGAVSLQSAYHALSMDAWDAADLLPGPHYGTFATTRKDGHGRTIVTTERARVGGGMEAHETRVTYLATGEPTVIARVRVGQPDPPVVRWMRYDTLGRMVLNVEPNTTRNFNPDPTTAANATKAWRYAYDDNGDLVGTSDARGCGVNYAYDAGGRLLGEDYSPCQSDQPDYSAADASTGAGFEVLNRYDTPESGSETYDDCTVRPELLKGRLVAISDRASHTVIGYDGRGRTACVAKQVAKPGVPSIDPANRYAPQWYSTVSTYDGADRPVQNTTGAKVLLGAGQQSFVSTQYAKSGAVRTIGGSYGVLVASITHDADGLTRQVVYGDAASTTTSFAYDQKRRVASVQTYRGAPSLWTSNPPAYTPAPNLGGPPSTLQLLLEDYDYGYDAVDNPIEIRDWRTASEWPAGSQPVSRKMQYDDLNRLTRIDYQYPAGTDPWTSPFAAEDQGQSDARRATPSPHVQFDTRTLWQTFQYDWLGNTATTDDDAKGFYDRSLGSIGNGTAGAGPYQLKGASQSVSARSGALNAAYDDAGYLVSMAVQRSGSCLPAGSVCAHRFAYAWDEVGRLLRARRWDLGQPGIATDPVPSGTPAADLAYSYDGSDNRVVKAATDSQGNVSYTVYMFGSVELRRAGFDGTNYERTVLTEVPYLAGIARVHYAATDVPTLTSGQMHVLLELRDHLGSAAITVDAATGELVERSTYTAYGTTESDYRPARWDAYRADYRFTGKEEDVECGIQYFGKRYFAPSLGRWMSADPLTIHGLGSDLNAYAYVHGSVLRATDPLGLDDPSSAPAGQTGSSVTNTEPITIVGHVPERADAAATINGAEASTAGFSLRTDAPTSRGEGATGWTVAGWSYDGQNNRWVSADGEHQRTSPHSGDRDLGFLLTQESLAHPADPTKWLVQASMRSVRNQIVDTLFFYKPMVDNTIGLGRAAVGVVHPKTPPLERALDAIHVAAAVFPLFKAVGTGARAVARGAAAAEAAWPVVEATEMTGIQANKVMGDAAADELAESLRQTGLTVEREVPYSTPVGTRLADLRVSGPDGTVRGLIEVKVGNSRYTALQRLKDFFIESIYGHPTNVVRYPTYP